MRRFVDMLRVRLTIFSILAWEMCVAPMWVASAAAATVHVPPQGCCVFLGCSKAASGDDRMTANEPDVWFCLLACRAKCPNSCERLVKAPAAQDAPAKKIEPARTCVRLRTTFDRAERFGFHTAREPRPSENLDRLRTVVLLM